MTFPLGPEHLNNNFGPSTPLSRPCRSTHLCRSTPTWHCTDHIERRSQSVKRRSMHSAHQVQKRLCGIRIRRKELNTFSLSSPFPPFLESGRAAFLASVNISRPDSECARGSCSHFHFLPMQRGNPFHILYVGYADEEILRHYTSE